MIVVGLQHDDLWRSINSSDHMRRKIALLAVFLIDSLERLLRGLLSYLLLVMILILATDGALYNHLNVITEHAFDARQRLRFALIFLLKRHCTRQPKVTQENITIVADKQIGGFDIPVHDAVRVNVGEGDQRIVHENGQVALGKRIVIRISHQTAQISLFVVHNEEYFVEV